MIRNDAHWLEVVDSFYSAAIDGSGWYAALEKLAEATGSKCGQLVGIGPNFSVPFHILTGIDPALIAPAVEAGGNDPDFNPRVKAGMNLAPLKVMAESEFVTPREQLHHPFYNEYANPWDVPFSCLTNLERGTDVLIGLAVLRSKKQGHIGPKQRSHFSALALHARAAVRTQLALEGQGAALLSGAMEALSLAAFVCDVSGQVKVMSPTAEALVGERQGLQLRSGQLYAMGHANNRMLGSAIREAALELPAPGKPALRTVILRNDGMGTRPLILDVVSLPSRQFEFSFVPRVLVVVRGAKRSDDRKATLLQMTYGVTFAEADIAIRLAKGLSAEAIAQARNVTVGTVRAQIKTILGKFGVNRQIELVACIGDL